MYLLKVAHEIKAKPFPCNRYKTVIHDAHVVEVCICECIYLPR